jgi:pyochelin synthetase
MATIIERAVMALPQPYAAPIGPMEARICDAFSRGTWVVPVGIDDDIFDLGADSLVAETVATDVETNIGRAFPISLFLDLGTPRKILAWLAGQRSAAIKLTAVDLALINAQMDGLGTQRLHSHMLATVTGGEVGKVPLFWWLNAPTHELPSFGLAWKSDTPLVGLYSAGSLAVGIPLAHHRALAEAVAESYAQELLARFGGMPFRLGGNCFGGRIANLVAQKLALAGQRVECLCTLDYAHSDLYEFSGPLLLLFGQESADRFHDAIRLGEAGWERPFRSQPETSRVPGGHGRFFEPENVGALADRIDAFLVAQHTGASL